MAESAPMVGTAARRAVLLTAIWAILVEGRPADLPAGVAVATILALYSLRLNPPRPASARLRPLALLALAPRIAWLGLSGGWDVARRALRRRPDIDPDSLAYPLDPPSERTAVALAAVVTLTPGTLAMDVAGDGLLIHVIDRRLPVLAQLRILEDGLRRGLGEPARRGGTDG